VARLLPEVADVLPWPLPWDAGEPTIDPASVAALVNRLRARAFARAGILGSRTHSPLPAALVLRLATIAPVAAVCRDDATGLLDVALPWDPDRSDLDEGLAVARALGADPDAATDRVALRHEPVAASVVRTLTSRERVRRPLVVVNPAPVPGPDDLAVADWAAIVDALVDDGFLVAVTGPPGSGVAGDRARTAVVELGERLRAGELLGVLRVATAAVVGDEVAASLAAAVGCAVVPVARGGRTRTLAPSWAGEPGAAPVDAVRRARVRRCEERVDAVLRARTPVTERAAAGA
jgi:hypothetical protein